jgi:hypothetical protein
MKSQAEMQKEHEVNNPGYTGNPTAPFGPLSRKRPKLYPSSLGEVGEAAEGRCGLGEGFGGVQ